MGDIARTRRNLKEIGVDIPPLINYDEFGKRFQETTSQKMSDSFLRLFWEDYLTGNDVTVEVYAKSCMQ